MQATFTQTTIAREVNIFARMGLTAIRVFVVAFGGAALWLARDGMNADGVAYLDASDEFLAGRWPWAGTGYWSPLYPTLLWIARLIGGTSPDRALAAAQAVNLVLFLLAFVAFEWLLRSVRTDPRRRSGGTEPNDIVWHILAYALFAWMTVGWIRVWLLTPDMGVAAVVFALAALALRLRSGRGRWGSAIALGVLLGAGYLMKAALLPVGIVMVGMLAFSLRDRRFAISGVAAVLFLAISAPQIAYVSRLKGSPTFSDVGRLQYLWFVAGVPGMVTSALPLPARLPDPGASDQTLPPLGADDPHPAIYDIDAPIPGTLPIWYDAGHWFRGVAAPFSPVAIARSLVRNVRVYLEVFALLLAGGLAAALAGGVSCQTVRAMRPDPLLVIPALAAMAIYGLVLVQTRYIAPFTPLLFLGLVPPWAVDQLSRRVRVGLATGAVVGLVLVPYQIRIDTAAWRGSASARTRVVSALEARGIGPGSRLGFIGESYDALWAYEANARFVTLVPKAEAGQFWALDAAGRERVLEHMRARGATAVVAETPALGVDLAGWERLPPAGPPVSDLVVYTGVPRPVAGSGSRPVP